MRRLTAAVLILAALSMAAGPAAAFELTVGAVRADTARVRMDFALEGAIPDEDEERIGTTPAALAYTIELWRDRSGWWDSLISSRTYGFRLEYDHLQNLYRVVFPDGRILEAADRPTLMTLLGRQEDVVAARLSDLKPGMTYYLAVTARLTPIDINKLREVEGWLGGEIRSGARGGVLGVPKAVVGILADLAGFGDRSTVSRSAPFRLREAGPPTLETLP